MNLTRAVLYRTMVVGASVALVGLLVVQVIWFVRAYALEEKQFNEKVNIALRSVADRILKTRGDNYSLIAPVRQVASNEFYVEGYSFLDYQLVDSLVREAFMQHRIDQPFILNLYSQAGDSVILGNFYHSGVASDRAACIGREQQHTTTDFAIVFPNQRASILGSLSIWIYSAGAFVVILLCFGYMTWDLSKQKKLAEMKNDFINNMTHELQTPITNIAMASEVLRSNTSLNVDRKEKYLTIIHQENLRLKTQVDQVLQIAMMERGELHLTKKRLNIHELLHDIAESFQMRIKSRSGSLAINFNAAKPVLLGDRLHLTNIFYNLLDNADKYSGENPQIMIETQDVETGILISVSDKGCGIKREVQHLIFDKFYRASSGDVHNVKGFGLGLTYVKKIVTAHHGLINVKSEENMGSRFDVYLPMSEA